MSNDEVICAHCGDKCPDKTITFDTHYFCCHGCSSVYQILNENGLSQFYDINSNPGNKPKDSNKHRYLYLENEEICNEILDFQDGELARVSLFIPSIHCVSCVWLLENLNKVSDAVVASQVNFLKREAQISFNQEKLSLRELAELLDKIGYAPIFEKKKNESHPKRDQRKLIKKVAVAGFCFGNIMLFSFPEYLNPDRTFAEDYRDFFSGIILALSIPVLIFCAKDYLVSAYKSIRIKQLNLDVPISIGIIALYAKSCFDIIYGHGPGYMDSFAGFVFFLLIGKWFQSKTYDYLSFERDHDSYMPLASTVLREDQTFICPINDIKIGDHLLIHNDEIIPVDGILLSEDAFIDYSFVTGESRSTKKQKNEKVYAGGRIIGSQVKIICEKVSNQSYLTDLWKQKAFDKQKESTLKKTTDTLSRYFIYAVLAIAILSGLIWSFIDPEQIPNVLIAVLIVACPCALALSFPFTYGNTIRAMGKQGLFLRNSDVVDQMSDITDIVFDKTGTLTLNHGQSVTFSQELSDHHTQLIASLCGNSIHPLSRSIYDSLKNKVSSFLEATDFEEIKGKGMSASIGNSKIRMGSADFIGAPEQSKGTRVYVEIDQTLIGFYTIDQKLRPGVEDLLDSLKGNYTLHLLSGDVNSDDTLFKSYFEHDKLIFNKQPKDKLDYINKLQENGHRVMMLGDGLNDAGALKASDFGISVSDDIYSFSPACDGIIDAKEIKQLPQHLQLSNKARFVLKASLLFSLFYNLIGLGFAISNQLSPLVAAIIMPLSSISIVTFTTLGIRFFQRKLYKN